MTTFLFLDDDLVRHTTFDDMVVARPGNSSVHHAFTFAEFFSVLVGFPGRFDEIWLDHDLGERDIHGDGLMAANLIILLPEEYRPRMVHIHSHNPAGAQRMFDVLDGVKMNVVVEPFHVA